LKHSFQPKTDHRKQEMHRKIKDYSKTKSESIMQKMLTCNVT